METCPSPDVVIVYDVTKEHSEHELQVTINEILLRGDVLCRGDELLVLGVLHSVTNPMGYQSKACPDSFGGTNARALEEEVFKKVDMYVDMLEQIAEQCMEEGVNMKVKITAGTPSKKVVLQEVVACKARWVILDWHLRRDLAFYTTHIPCKVAFIQDSLSIEVLKSNATKVPHVLEHKLFYSLWKPVLPIFDMQDSVNRDNSVISCGSYSAFGSFQESSGIVGHSSISSFSYKAQKEGIFSVPEATGSSSKPEKYGQYSTSEHTNHSGPQSFSNKYDNVLQRDYSEKPILCSGCGLRTILYIKESMRFRFSEIQAATSDFSKENMLGEGGYGHVYKGILKDGQTIAAKLHKEASSQGYNEFRSEIHVLSFARHKNIVLLLGYCFKENHNILVYEYICNRSLEWHLFDQSATMLEWHKRWAIAVGTAKGLRFLHEECRAGPIIHRDLRPSNILLTHDFVPMLGDFGLAKWKTNGDSVQTRVLGTLGYLAPEYAEDGIVSVKTDVYAFGVVLLQLISGHGVFGSRERNQPSLLQWAEPLIEILALHELIDPHLGESYDTYELYHMTRAAYLCVRRKPEMRPSMGELLLKRVSISKKHGNWSKDLASLDLVLRLLEGENEHVQDLAQQFMQPKYRKS